MKLQFKQQGFQEEAARAVVDVFAGQGKSARRFVQDLGRNTDPTTISFSADTGIGFGNQSLQLTNGELLQNVRALQGNFGLDPNQTLAELTSKIEWDNGQTEIVQRPAFAIEMETGTGKTYTYIKTMYELNERYGWSKFIIVVPSVAIREGVAKTFTTTADHFKQMYGRTCRHFIYNSTRLNELDNFASDSGINVMIINSQAFAARGQDARRIYAELDSFSSRRPIDVIASVNPIVIVDEPQSVLGTEKSSNVTRHSLGKFKPLFYLTYSATHRENFNLIYRLDAVDAYEQKLVKKIYVTGFETVGSMAASGYLYVQAIKTYPKRSPAAVVTFEYQTQNGSRSKPKDCKKGTDLYIESGNLPVYKGYVVSNIDARTNEVEFTNGVVLRVGQVQGDVAIETIRRLQIRETIKNHLEKERALFKRGVKVLSLFFIDEVAKYRLYGEGGETSLGEYAKIFEEEYNDAVSEILLEELEFSEDEEYKIYLSERAEDVHDGYFSKDNKGRAVDTRGETVRDESTYDLIMKNKERLLSFNEPTRFIFSHSALREGWDNPNVFQICTLREANGEIRKRQEIGRGLRLCVNQNGERMDKESLGEIEVHEVNKLTVIASESYNQFAKDLQDELAEVIAKRPKKVDENLFANVELRVGDEVKILNTREISRFIVRLEDANLLDKNGLLTDTFHELEDEGKTEAIAAVLEQVDPELSVFARQVRQRLELVYDPKRLESLVNDKRKDQKAHLDKDKIESESFKKMWEQINSKTYYQVQFSDEELEVVCKPKLNELRVSVLMLKTETGSLEAKENQVGMVQEADSRSRIQSITDNHTYDLLGEIASGTNLTRKLVAKLLQGMESAIFKQYKRAPYDFIQQAIKIINNAKAEIVVKNIVYKKIGDRLKRDDIFKEYGTSGDYDKNLINTPNYHLYDKLLYDSEIEKTFAEAMEISDRVELYVKLPGGYKINTPVGTSYNPDWAIVLKGQGQDDKKEVYFIAETKGSTEKMDLRGAENAKIICAKKHYEAISDNKVKYHAVTSFDEVLRRLG